MRIVLNVPLLAAFTLMGCQLFGLGGGNDELHRLQREVSEEIGVPTADEVSECRTIAFGSKPCGGPWRYLVYSTASSDTVKIASLVARYNAREHALNLEEGRASDCSLALRPDTVLVDGVCQPAHFRP